MSDAIEVEIVSPEHLLFSEKVKSVSVPGAEGYFTIMGDHAPLMSILKPGFVLVETEDGTSSFYVGGGFADVLNSKVTILTEDAKTGKDFDISQIEIFIEQAEEQLAKAETADEKNSAQALLDGWKNLVPEAKAQAS